MCIAAACPHPALRFAQGHPLPEGEGLIMKLLAFIGSLFIRALHATLRVRHVNVENIERERQYILAFWHAHLVLMLHSRYRRPIDVMISRSKDGEIIARVFDW